MLIPVPHRVRELKDGRKIVMAERVFEFLDWASKLFDISVCSLGDQPYVDMVCQVLNTEGQIIKSGVAYSARGEFTFLSEQKNSWRPPKDLASLFAFYDLKSDTAIQIEPIILDDNASMWPATQQNNIIVSHSLILDHPGDGKFTHLECCLISGGSANTRVHPRGFLSEIRFMGGGRCSNKGTLSNKFGSIP